MFDSVDEARGYLSGIIDGEGTVYCKGYARRVVICNTSVSILW